MADFTRLAICTQSDWGKVIFLHRSRDVPIKNIEIAEYVDFCPQRSILDVTSREQHFPF